MLPVIGKKKVAAIIAEAQDAKFKLEFLPSTTTEYVNSLIFLDEIQERVSSGSGKEGHCLNQMRAYFLHIFSWKRWDKRDYVHMGWNGHLS